MAKAKIAGVFDPGNGEILPFEMEGKIEESENSFIMVGDTREFGWYKATGWCFGSWSPGSTAFVRSTTVNGIVLYEKGF